MKFLWSESGYGTYREEKLERNTTDTCHQSGLAPRNNARFKRTNEQVNRVVLEHSLEPILQDQYQDREFYNQDQDWKSRDHGPKTRSTGLSEQNDDLEDYIPVLWYSSCKRLFFVYKEYLCFTISMRFFFVRTFHLRVNSLLVLAFTVIETWTLILHHVWEHYTF